MIKKINITSFRIFALAWALLWFSAAAKSYRPFEQTNFSAIFLCLAMALLPIGIGWHRIWTRHAEIEARRWQFMWLEIAKQWPVVACLRQLFLVLSSTLLIAFAILSTPLTLTLSAESCASLLDSAGFYELAERLYQMKLGSKPSETFSHQSCHRFETDKQLCQRNQAVVAVYGAGSLETTRRYYYAAIDVLMREGYGSNNSHIFEWLEKSLRLAREQKSDEDILKALVEMAIIERIQEKYSESDRLIVEIEQLLAHSTDARKLSGNSRPLLHWLAEETGKTALARATDLQPAGRTKKRFLDATSVAIMLPLFLIFALTPSLGFVSGGFKVVILFLCFARAKTNLKNATDTKSALTALNRLITIDLYRGNFARAWQNSEKLLDLVGKDSEQFCLESTQTSRS